MGFTVDGAAKGQGYLRLLYVFCWVIPWRLIQTPGNYPEEITQHTEHGESWKSRIISDYLSFTCEYYSTSTPH